MILSFKDQTTEDIFNGVSSKKALKVPTLIWRTTQRKLDMLNAAHGLTDLKSPPGNQLGALKGKLKGAYSIRINDQFRIVFIWASGNAEEVHITDYH